MRKVSKRAGNKNGEGVIYKICLSCGGKGCNIKNGEIIVCNACDGTGEVKIYLD